MRSVLNVIIFGIFEKGISLFNYSISSAGETLTCHSILVNAVINILQPDLNMNLLTIFDGNVYI